MLKENVPTDVPGIAFLSGGQTEVEATENLNLINKYNDTSFIMTYSYGRALQQSALKFWSKDINNINGTQKIFNHRANMCTLAAQGKWSKELDKIKNKKFVYLISPNKITDINFYDDLALVLSSKKISFFQLRLKKETNLNKLIIGKKIKKICNKYKVKFLINDDPLLAKKLNADGCHLGQKDMD